MFFYKTPDRAFAESQWEYINTLHSSGYFSTRCMVPGKRKAFTRCRDTNKCSACPYGRTPETKQSPLVSWDGFAAIGGIVLVYGIDRITKSHYKADVKKDSITLAPAGDADKPQSQETEKEQ